MDIKVISIHIETEGTAIETVFVSKEHIAEVMGGNIKFSDLVLDIINKAENGKKYPIDLS